MVIKTYVGYDLGDGETITDLATLKSGELKTKTVFDDMTMPDTVKSGQAMPTVFAFSEDGDVIFSETILADPEAVRDITVNFKRRPSDLLKGDVSMPDAEQIDFVKKCSDWPDASVWANGNTPEMLSFKNAVITFTNAIFKDRNYVNRLKSAAQNSDEIVFCVGHPTNWTALDIAIYELILKSTVLGLGKYEGKKTSVIMEAESRAAFLYSKDMEAFGRLPKGSSVLLIDVGSSTIDITAMTASSNNHQYNSGSNYLGVRSIDFMIKNWYLEKIKQQPANWSMYQSLVRRNPTIPNALTLSCRKAKEQLYSSSKGMAVVYFGLSQGVRLVEKDLDAIIESTPISDILRSAIHMNDQECNLMGKKPWKKLFKDFLNEKKAEMTKQGIKIGCVILTGSASRMPFVPKIVREVFNEVSFDSLKYDMDPSRTISKGLALVGPSNEKSKAFQDDLNRLLNKKLDNIIEANIPALGQEMGKIISDILTPKMKRHIKDWKNGDIITLDGMNAKIRDDCSEKNLTELLSNDEAYRSAVQEWLKDKVGRDIAVELKGLCEKYGVKDISIDDLNIMSLPKISLGNIPLDPLDFMDTISAVVAIISGVVAYASIATIMAVIVVVISFISESLAASLFVALVGMGPAGWTVLALIVGVSVAALVSGGFDAVKERFKDKVMGWNLPKIARQKMTDEKVNKSFRDANLAKQIEDAFKDEKVKSDIVSKISANLKGQIEKRAEDIKYAIESR